MKSLHRLLVVAAFLGLFAYVLAATPLAWGSAARGLDILAQTDVTAQEAAAMVQARTGGRILAIKTIRSDGQVVYRIKVLTPDGEVRIFYVDAATGSM